MYPPLKATPFDGARVNVDLPDLLLQRKSREVAVRPEGANHQWRRIPPRELSIDLEADERFGRVTGRAGAS
jgi:hypothetical protein